MQINQFIKDVNTEYHELLQKYSKQLQELVSLP
jgi:cell division septum initiation protein DivIVA